MKKPLNAATIRSENFYKRCYYSADIKDGLRELLNEIDRGREISIHLQVDNGAVILTFYPDNRMPEVDIALCIRI